MDEQLGPAGTRKFDAMCPSRCLVFWQCKPSQTNPLITVPHTMEKLLKCLTIKNGNLKLTGGDAIAGLLEFSGKLAGTSPIEVLNLLYACKFPN